MMKFEDLEAWQKARQLVHAIYQLTHSKTLCYDFGICGQIQRAVVSIMSNIAEGFERSHVQEKLQFYNIARGSTGEVRSLLYVVEDNFPATVQLAAARREEAVSVGKLISGLIRVTEERKC
jgi:four helix bundle protein